MFDLSHLLSVLPLLLLGTSAAPAPAAPAADESFDSAGKALLASLTDDQKNAPLAGLDDVDDDAPAGGTTTTTPAKTAAAAPVPAEAATDVGEPITRETDGAEWNEDAKRWTLDGKFVAGAAPEGWEPPAAVTTEAAAPVAEVKPTDEPAGVKVVLPGLSEKGEADIEVEVDAELAQRIQRLKNEGLRAKDYQARRAVVEQREAQIENYVQEMEIDPVGFHLNKMPRDRQIEVARALLVEHMDDLLPDIERLQDPAARLAAVRQTRDNLKQSQDRLLQQRQTSALVRDVVRATEALVPDGTDDATFNDFVADARRDLARAADQGERVTPTTVKQLLVRRLAMYGFDKPKPAAAPPAPAAIPSARPVSDRARDIAARRPVTADAAAQQARIRRTQAARAAGQRVAPAGAGAAPVQTPALPPEAEADIESMSRYLRKSNLPQTWGAGPE